MNRPIIQIGDQVREMTADEYDQWKSDVKDIEEQKALADAKLAARASARAKLAKLGLTDDELEAFLGI